MPGKCEIAIKSKRNEHLNQDVGDFRLDSALQFDKVECDSCKSPKSGKSSAKEIIMVRSEEQISEKLLHVQNLESFKCVSQDLIEQKSDSASVARFQVV
jgi:hypothetical protein